MWSERLARRHTTWFPLLLFLLLSPGAALSQAPAPDCSTDSMGRLLSKSLGDSYVELVKAPCGLSLVVQPGSPDLRMGMWFAYNPQGDLMTSSRRPSCGPDEQKELSDLESRVVAALEQYPEWASCTALACEKVQVDSAESAFQRTIEEERERAPWPDFNVLVMTTYGLVAVAWLFMVFLALQRLVLSAKRQRGLLGVTLGLTVGGFLARALSSPRLPMSHALLDFEQLRDVGTMLTGGLFHQQTLNHLYLPANGVLAAGLGYLLDFSVQDYFWVTTVLGSLSVGVAAVLGHQVTGSKWAAWFAGLGVAASPMAIQFSNGYNLGTLVGLMLLVNVSLFVDWAKKPGWVNSLGYIASLLLLAAGRGESIVVAFWVVAMQAVWLMSHRGLAGLLAAWRIFPAAALINLPLALGIVLAIPKGEDGVATAAGQELLLAVVQASVVVALYLVARRLKPTSSWWMVPVALGTGLWLLARIVLRCEHGILVPESYFLSSEPYVEYWAREGSSALGQAMGLSARFISSPALFPSLWVLLLFASLAPGWRRQKFVPQGIAWLGFGSVLFYGVMVSQTSDGVATLEGARYMQSMLPLLGLLVGLGAWKLLEILDREQRRQWLIAAGLTVVLAAPLVTHRRVFSDTLRNPQNEWLFTQDALRTIDGPTTILYPDHGESGEFGTQDPAVSLVIYRTVPMVDVMLMLEPREGVELMGFKDFAAKGVEEGRSVVALLGWDCYHQKRDSRPVETCSVVAGLSGATTVLEHSYPNRIMTMASLAFDLGPHVPVVTDRLVRLAPKAVDTLRRRLTHWKGPGATPALP